MTQAAQLASYGSNNVGLAFKNRIINGAMMIDQRNAGAAVNPAVNGNYTLDRWITYLTVASKYSTQQNQGSVTPPAGFINYLGVTSLSAYSISATDLFALRQRIEGLNISDLAWGTASAATVTLSFWVRSSLTGTFGGSIANNAADRSYPFSYTISSAGAWEQKSITIPGDTTGTWLTTNGIGMQVTFGLGIGSTYSGAANTWAAANYVSVTGATSVVGTNGATFYITGIQLEKGSTATSWDTRSYGTELNLCYRYYERRGVGSQNNERLTTTGLANGSTTAQFPIQHLVPKRATPSINVGNLNNTTAYDGTSAGTPSSWNLDNTGFFITNIQVGGINTALGRAIHWTWNNATPTPFVEISSEL